MVFLYIGLTICVVLLVLSLIIFKWQDIKKFFKSHFYKKDSEKKSKKRGENGGKLKPSETQFRPIVKPPEDKSEKKNLDQIDMNYKPEVDKLKDFSKLTKSSKNSLDAQEERLRQKKMLDAEFEDVKKFLSMGDYPNHKNSSSFFDNARKSNATFDNAKSVASLNSEREFLKNNKKGSSFDSSPNEIEFLTKKGKEELEANKQKFESIENYQGAISRNIDRSNLTGDNDIDLSLLPPRLKNFVLSAILARKNFDD